MIGVSTQHILYKEFYKKTLPLVISHLRRFGIDKKEDLEDIVQDTYTEAFKSWESLKSNNAEVAWLLTIARRRFGRFLEAKKRFPSLLTAGHDQESPNGPVSPEEFIPDESRSPIDEQVAAIDLTQKLLTAIQDHSRSSHGQDQGRVITSFYIYGESLSTISEQTGINISTLTTWLSRFRKKAEKELKRWSKDSIIRKPLQTLLPEEDKSRCFEVASQAGGAK